MPIETEASRRGRPEFPVLSMQAMVEGSWIHIDDSSIDRITSILEPQLFLNCLATVIRNPPTKRTTAETKDWLSQLGRALRSTIQRERSTLMLSSARDGAARNTQEAIIDMEKVADFLAGSKTRFLEQNHGSIAASLKNLNRKLRTSKVKRA
jgi:hypothetical protein